MKEPQKLDPQDQRSPDLQESLRSALRTVPVQARAVESVSKILDTAASLLDEVGLEAFNTNLLANRANVRVRTVYRYFPDKYAVIIALAHYLAADWDTWMGDDYEQLANPDLDWEKVQRRNISSWLKKLSNQPGGVSVLKSLRTVPELQDFDMTLLDQMTTKMSEALKARGVRLGEKKLRLVCHTALQSVDMGVEHYIRLDETDRRAFLDELIKMHISYLREYI